MWPLATITIGNESVPIQLAQCWFPGLAISNAKILIYFSNKIYTHPFNGPLSKTTRVGRYQKGKTNLGFTQARDSEWQWHQLGYASLHLTPGQITMPVPHLSVFYRPDALPVAQPTVSKH